MARPPMLANDLKILIWIAMINTGLQNTYNVNQTASELFFA
jgi:hypothetical protein